MWKVVKKEEKEEWNERQLKECGAGGNKMGKEGRARTTHQRVRAIGGLDEKRDFGWQCVRLRCLFHTFNPLLVPSSSSSPFPSFFEALLPHPEGRPKVVLLSGGHGVWSHV